MAGAVAGGAAVGGAVGEPVGMAVGGAFGGNKMKYKKEKYFIKKEILTQYYKRFGVSQLKLSLAIKFGCTVQSIYNKLEEGFTLPEVYFLCHHCLKQPINKIFVEYKTIAEKLLN